MSYLVAVWRIAEDKPQRVRTVAVSLERDMESWIEADPSLVQEGLKVVGRQVHTEAGPLDLLAVDPQGRWCVIEIKKGSVRRETIAQALDYASCIASMRHDALAQRVRDYLEGRGGPDVELVRQLVEEASDDESPRSVAIFVVGTGQDPGLKRMVDFLTESGGIPITVVSFGVFDVGQGQRLLMRQLTEGETRPETARDAWSESSVIERAERNGLGEVFRRILKASEELGLYARACKKCIMYAPPANRIRCLFTVWTDRTASGGMSVYVSAEAFEQFYGVPADEVRETFQSDGWLDLTPNKVESFLDGLRELLGRDTNRDRPSPA